jgi:hypothetical protein
VLFLKVQCHEMDICFKCLNILISTLCVCADGCQDLTKAFHYPVHTIIHFLFAPLKWLANFEIAY